MIASFRHRRGPHPDTSHGPVIGLAVGSAMGLATTLVAGIAVGSASASPMQTAVPSLLRSHLPASSLAAVQAAADGPDLARRADEDARIAAAADEIARSEARLDAAEAALRLDLPPRLRTRIWWTPIPADIAGRASEAAARANALADATFTDLLASTHPAVDRLQARAGVIRTVARALADRVADDAPADWTGRLARLHSDAADAPDRTSQLDGPTLLVLAAAALANPDAGARAARDLHARAGAVPDGIDALEYGIIESLIEAGGLDPDRRRKGAEAMLREPRPAPDRLLLAAVHLDATLETGRSPDAAIAETIRVMLPSRGVNAEDRSRLVRAFADIASAAESEDTEARRLAPIVALARLARVTAGADPTVMRSSGTDALIARATADTSPDVRAEAWLEAATILMRRGEADAALDAIISAIEASPRHPKASVAAGLAMRLAEGGRDDATTDSAIARLVAALPDDPQRHRWSLVRGDRALAAGRRPAAREAWSSIPLSADVGVEATLRVLRLDAEKLDTRAAERLLVALDGLEDAIPNRRDDARRVDADLLRIKALSVLERTTSAADVATRFVDPSGVPESLRGEVAMLALPALERAGRGAEADRLRTALATLDPALAARAAGDRIRRDFNAVLSAIDRDDRAEADRIASESLRSGGFSLEAALTAARERPESSVQAGWMLAAAGRHADARRVADAVVAAHPGVTEGLYLQAALQGGRIQAPPRTRPAPPETDAAAAVRTLSRINAGSPRGSAWWWRSELEKLEILAALDRDLVKIDARLQRLETEFPNLGGPAFERRARALRNSLRGSGFRD